jgi:hypothetical protein
LIESLVSAWIWILRCTVKYLLRPSFAPVKVKQTGLANSLE